MFSTGKLCPNTWGVSLNVPEEREPVFGVVLWDAEISEIKHFSRHCYHFVWWIDDKITRFFFEIKGVLGKEGLMIDEKVNYLM